MGIGCDKKKTTLLVGSGQHSQTDIHSTQLIGGRKVYPLMLCHMTLIIANDKMLLWEKFILCSLL